MNIGVMLRRVNGISNRAAAAQLGGTATSTMVACLATCAAGNRHERKARSDIVPPCRLESAPRLLPERWRRQQRVVRAGDGRGDDGDRGKTYRVKTAVESALYGALAAWHRR
jgi:acyl-CoA thioesterase